MNNKTVHVFAMGILLFALAVAIPAQESEGDTVGTVSFRAVAGPTWRVAEIEGDGISLQGGSNALVLEIGGRYVFDLSDVDSESFPMELRDGSGQVVLSQRDEVESEALEDADVSVSEDEIQFTLTEELASRISFYRAATYPSMLGVIRTYSREAAEAAAEEAAEQAEEQDGDTGESSDSNE
ncbi:MAG: hypothetical protein R6U25_06825 [Alkalispirochaeta sp.]